MMLSPQAARMGTVFTTLRNIGPRALARHRGATVGFQSTLAVEEDEDHHRYLGHAKAAAVRVERPSSSEPWMINLHRGHNNAWLSDTRNENEWFTGLAPKDCPGKSIVFRRSWDHCLELALLDTLVRILRFSGFVRTCSFSTNGRRIVS